MLFCTRLLLNGTPACLLLQPEGLKEMYGLIEFYKENAKILKDTFQQMGFSVYGESQDRLSESVCLGARVRASVHATRRVRACQACVSVCPLQAWRHPRTIWCDVPGPAAIRTRPGGVRGQ